MNQERKKVAAKDSEVNLYLPKHAVQGRFSERGKYSRRCVGPHTTHSR